jgi:hypothetical protein
MAGKFCRELSDAELRGDGDATLRFANCANFVAT